MRGGAVRAAIAYEHQRQSRLLAKGQAVAQVNMGWDEGKRRTVLQRSKESSEDYRYFPEPDLPPLRVAASWVDAIRRGLPEMPWRKQERYVREWGVRPQEAELLAGERSLAEYFEAAAQAFGLAPGRPQLLAQWIATEVLALLYQQGDGQDVRRIAQIKIAPAQLAALLAALQNQSINNNTAKQVLAAMFETGEDAQAIIEREGLAMVSDTSVLDAAIQAAFAAHPQERARLQAGEGKLLGFFMGQVMRRMQGRADPQTARTRLQALL